MFTLPVVRLRALTRGLRVKLIVVALGLLASIDPLSAGALQYTYFSDPSAGPGGQTDFFAVDDAGIVYGKYLSAGGSAWTVFTYQNGVTHDVASGIYPFGANDLGVAVGGQSILNADGSITTSPLCCFADINDSGLMVGSLGAHAGMAVNGVWQDLGLPYLQSFATGVNDLGQIVGYYWDGVSPSRGFLWQNGAFITVVSPLGEPIININDLGQMVADDYFFDGSAWINISQPATGWAMQLQDLNDLGVMVGHNGNQGVIITPASVPEPGTWLLAGLGLLSTVVSKRSWRSSLLKKP